MESDIFSSLFLLSPFHSHVYRFVVREQRSLLLFQCSECAHNSQFLWPIHLFLFENYYYNRHLNKKIFIDRIRMEICDCMLTTFKLHLIYRENARNFLRLIAPGKKGLHRGCSGQPLERCPIVTQPLSHSDIFIFISHKKNISSITPQRVTQCMRTIFSHVAKPLIESNFGQSS